MGIKSLLETSGKLALGTSRILTGVLFATLWQLDTDGVPDPGSTEGYLATYVFGALLCVLSAYYFFYKAERYEV